MYANRRRIRGRRGKALFRLRAELCERGFAHFFTTCGMRRTHLRGHANILKRLLVHVSGFNLGLVMRKLFGRGTPRGWRDLIHHYSSVLTAASAVWRLMIGCNDIFREVGAIFIGKDRSPAITA